MKILSPSMGTAMLALCLALAGCGSKTVPDVTGQTQADASLAITRAGLTVGIIAQAHSATIAPGTVISENPVAGASVSSGSVVALLVSQGPQPVTVPNVTGQTQSAAVTRLAGANLSTGTVIQQCSNVVAGNLVISQNPAAGGLAAFGRAVTLEVSTGPCSVTVPNLVNQTQADASVLITGAGLILGTVTPAYSSTGAPGSVLSQTPDAGAVVGPGFAVALIVSEGPQPIMVPNVVDQTQSLASAAITGAGLKVGTITHAYSTAIAPGAAISQSPTGGIFVSPGSAVALVVSQGPPLLTVPDVVGMTQAAASTTIGGAALPVGSVTQAYSWTVAFGSVISESPAAGTQVGPGIAVALTISEGPQPVTVPNVVALAQAAASASIIGAGLALGIVTQAYSSTVPVGSVISQSPTSGMAVLPGFIVALTISKGPQPVSVPDVVGLTQTAADTAIAKALLTLGTVTQVYSVRVPAGEVVGQAPPAGTIATPGTAVDLDVSERPQPVNIEMVLVPSGTFTMGNSGVGDDTMGWSDESPGHLVTLNAYQSGKYDVTNKQYCGVLNWALAQGYLMDNAGVPWAGTGDIFAGGNLQILLSCTDTDCNIEYLGGVFSSKTRTGLPGTTVYSMDTHPVVMVSWYGAAAFCNWLSEMQGLTPCYDMTAVDWPLVVAPPKQGGYRLPTEAEWERAAAWDGAKHWIYGFMSDTNAGNNRCNDQWRRVSATWIYVNPLGLTTYPYTSPVDWFNGLNVSPNGTVATVNSVSPVGAYDMSGNVWQWCDDGPESYNSGTQTNPLGPTSGSARVRRGGGWSGPAYNCRTADRSDNLPMHTFNYVGFRLAKS